MCMKIFAIYAENVCLPNFVDGFVVVYSLFNVAPVVCDGFQIGSLFRLQIDVIKQHVDIAAAHYVWHRSCNESRTLAILNRT